MALSVVSLAMTALWAISFLATMVVIVDAWRSVPPSLQVPLGREDHRLPRNLAFGGLTLSAILFSAAGGAMSWLANPDGPMVGLAYVLLGLGAIAQPLVVADQAIRSLATLRREGRHLR
ncbi:MAG: hypothetical protein V4466_12735 [Pseudomonadota bacterium]